MFKSRGEIARLKEDIKIFREKNYSLLDKIDLLEHENKFLQEKVDPGLVEKVSVLENQLNYEKSWRKDPRKMKLIKLVDSIDFFNWKYSFDTDELFNLFVKLKSLENENSSLISTNKSLIERNLLLEDKISELKISLSKPKSKYKNYEYDEEANVQYGYGSDEDDPDFWLDDINAYFDNY